MNQFSHRPVMFEEVVELFRAVPAGTVVDATVGGGGHAAGLLESRPDVRLIGLDRDLEAIDAARERLSTFGDRVELRHQRFDAIESAVGASDTVVGVLFDLGVSSWQFDAPQRGFSYRNDGPLDMRMDSSGTVTAEAVVNEWEEAKIARLLSENGERRFARRIAKAIVDARPIATTGELAETVRTAIPAATRRSGGHPAKRTFQAIRIAVNDELAVLPVAIDAAIRSLAEHGRCVVLSYHSGEDRIVKDRFLAASTGGCTCPADLPCACGAVASVRLLNRGARKPSAAEIASNPRSASARLRAVEKLVVSSGSER